MMIQIPDRFEQVRIALADPELPEGVRAILLVAQTIQVPFTGFDLGPLCGRTPRACSHALWRVGWPRDEALSPVVWSAWKEPIQG